MYQHLQEAEPCAAPQARLLELPVQVKDQSRPLSNICSPKSLLPSSLILHLIFCVCLSSTGSQYSIHPLASISACPPPSIFFMFASCSVPINPLLLCPCTLKPSYFFHTQFLLTCFIISSTTALPLSTLFLKKYIDSALPSVSFFTSPHSSPLSGPSRNSGIALVRAKLIVCCHFSTQRLT